jgi:GntR family transcriptional regulator
MNIQLDFRSDTPIYIQIVEQVQQQIANGGIKLGDQLPTVRALAAELRINFNTVARSYRLLDEAGIISTQQGRGTYILEQPPLEINDRLRRESLEALARRYLTEAKRLGFNREQSLFIFREIQDSTENE